MKDLWGILRQGVCKGKLFYSNDRLAFRRGYGKPDKKIKVSYKIKFLPSFQKFRVFGAEKHFLALLKLILSVGLYIIINIVTAKSYY